MLDLRLVRENPELVRQGIRDKHMTDVLPLLEELLGKDVEERSLRHEMEGKQARRNAVSREIGLLKRDGDDTAALLAEMGELAQELRELEERSRNLSGRVHELLLELPDLLHESVPPGATEEDNVVVAEGGAEREYGFVPRPHWELPSYSDWVDLEAGVRMAGAGFPVFRGAGARLVGALQSWLLSCLAEHGFTELRPPLLASPAAALGAGMLPDKEGQMYEV